jgi:carboxymethylenebutenolidase
MTDIQTRDIEFQTTVGAARGYLALPPGDAGPRPAVIVIHEWWGLNEHTRDIVRRFAREGYVALAPDLYGGVLAKDADEAGRLMGELRIPNAVAILEAAIDALPEDFPPYNVGAIGFCMGGGIALWLACKTLKVGAVAAFYGDPPPEDELARIHTPILFVAAENDPWINAEKVAALSGALERRGKPYCMIQPPGTQHAFFNDTRKEVYNKEAADVAWKTVLDFFGEHLRKTNTPLV